MKKKIIVLGAGYAGILTAKKMEKMLKGSDVDIKIIDKNPFHTMLTELHEVAANRVDEDAIRINLKKVFAKRNVEVVLDSITKIDTDDKRLVGEKGNYEYDYLVIATGSRPTFFGVEGVEEFSKQLWSYDDAVALKAHILKMFRLAIREINPEKRRKMLTFSVVGAGFTGVEMIGELAEWVPILCEQYHIEREEVTLLNIDVLDRPVPVLPEKLSKKVEKRYKKMGIQLITGASVIKVTKDSLTYKIGEAVTEVDTETVVWTAGVEGSGLVCNSKECLELLGRGRIQTDKYLRATGREDIFVAGDNIFYIPEGEEKPVPQMVENAEHSADTVAENLVATLRGNNNMEEYKPKFHGVMVCVGGRYGVAHVGFPGKMIALNSFFSMFTKHFINLIYFVQVLGWNKCYAYMKHEFFGVKDRRSFVGGYFSKASPNFWLLPLRLFVGGKWLLEGVDKMKKVVANPSEIFLFNIPSADGVSAASEGAEAAAEYGEALPVPEFITNIVDWFMLHIVSPIAPVFQGGMVVAELLIGLALIAGLFTAPVAVFSTIMCVMIYTSGMAAPEILWFMVASIALIGGSGSTFGLDYYVQPWVKKRWKKLGFVKKLYIYND